jgi:capsid portal protein
VLKRQPSHGSGPTFPKYHGDDVPACVISTDEKHHETAYARIVEQLLRLDTGGAVYEFFMPPADEKEEQHLSLDDLLDDMVVSIIVDVAASVRSLADLAGATMR